MAQTMTIPVIWRCDQNGIFETASKLRFFRNLFVDTRRGIRFPSNTKERRGDRMISCSDCAAIFCERCVGDGTFAMHSCEAYEFED